MARRGGGGLRGGGGRVGGGLGGSRGGSVRGLGSTGLGGSSGRAGRGAIPTPGRGGGLGGGGLRTPAPRAPVGRPPSRAGSFGAGVGVGMGMGMMAGGGRRRRRGWGGGWGGGWGWGGRRRRMGMGMGGVHHHHHHHGGGMGMGGRRGGGGCGSGCTTILLMIMLVVLIISVISWVSNASTPQYWVGGAQQGWQDPFPGVIESTRIRTPLEAGAATTSGPLFTDHLGWIGNRTQLEAGMNNFHQATGVRPHLYILGEIEGIPDPAWPTDNQLMDFAEGLYSELFQDEAHVLLVFFENDDGQYGMAVIPGNQARSVIDQEAQDILMDFVQRYYYADISEEEWFSRAFNLTGERIMHVPPEPPDNRAIWQTIIIVAGVLLLIFLLFRWWQKKQEQKNLEAEQLERVLNQPLETIGSPVSDAAHDLAQQYTQPGEHDDQ